MVSDSDLVTRLREILRDSDLEKATPGSVRRQLEADFGVDLSERKTFISEQIDAYLQSLGNSEDEEEVDDEGEEGKCDGSDEGDGAARGEVEEEEEEVEGKRSKKRRRSKKPGKEVKNRGGFNKLCSLSPQLQSFVGESVLARTEVVKRMWAYIRENNLQDPNNKRKILCDESLHKLFSVNSIDMFQMNKALAKHIWPLTAEDDVLQEKIKCEECVDPPSEEEAINPVEKAEEDDTKEDEEEEEIDVSQRKKRRSTKEDKGVKKRVGGFNKLCGLSPQLQAITGEAELARTEVVKKLWAYIRENNLQDPKNKQNIICDESLQSLFHVDSINMFKMNKELSKHIWPLNDGEVPKNTSQKEEKCEEKCKTTRDEDEENQNDKKQKKGGSGFTAPLPLSDALVKFFGTGESALSRADVVKRMWEYIKQNDLQDPSDKRRVICDDKLRELFEVDSFHGFSVAKLLAAHFVKAGD